MKYLLCVLLLQISLLPEKYTAAAQTPSQQPTAAPVAAATIARDSAVAPTPKPPRTVRIVQVASITNPRKDTLRLNDQIIVRVVGLRQLLEAQNIKPEALRLYIDDVMLPDPPVSVDTRFESDTATVRFFLQRNAKTETTWQLFYKLPFKYEHPAHIGLGLADGQLAETYPARDKNVLLELIRPWHLVVALLLLVGLLSGTAWLARNSSLLRNDWSNQLTAAGTGAAVPAVLPAIDAQYRNVSFSLLKVQKAFWTILGLSSYFTIYLVTGELPIIPDGLLALLGIGLASDWIGKLINRSQDEKNDARHQDAETRGFFTDIITDERGVSIARLQFIAFNTAAGLYFVRYVFKNMGMPTFDPQILTLLGVSSVALLAAKTQENLTPVATPTPQQAAAAAALQQAAAAPAAAAAAPAAAAEAPAVRPVEDDNMAPAVPDTPGMAPPNLALG